MHNLDISNLLILLIIFIRFLQFIQNDIFRRLFKRKLPKNIKEYTYHKDVTVLIIGTKHSGKKSIIEAYNNTKMNNRFYFPSETIHFIEINFETLWSGKLKPDVIWFITNYHGQTKTKDFQIINKCFPDIPVIVVLNKVDQLQEFSGHAFDLIATKELPNHLKFSKHLEAIKQRYKLLQEKKVFRLSQVMLTSMSKEEKTDRPVGLLGLYQATLNCMDDKQFNRYHDQILQPEINSFLKIVQTIKKYKKNSWRIILLCGSSNSGKSTLINYLFKKKNLAKIGLNGMPTTKTLEIYEDNSSNIVYIDSPGLERHDNTDIFIRLKSIRPDLIWLITNYESAIESVELNISIEHFPNTPILLIVNKVDILQELTITEKDLRNFDKHVPNALKDFTKLISVRQRLINYPSMQNMHRLILMSLRECEDDDKPIGLTNLNDITKQHFNNQTDEIEQSLPSNNNISTTKARTELRIQKKNN